MAMYDAASEGVVKVLLTGFGPFAQADVNPSQLIAERLSRDSELKSRGGRDIKLVVPTEPLQAAYHDLISTAPALIERHNPDLVVHMGLAVGQEYFSIERSASREGYHEIPDVARRVLTRGENKNVFGKAAARLETDLDVESAVEAAVGSLRGVKLPTAGTAGENGKSKEKEKGKGKGKRSGSINGDGRQVDVRVTDAVGNFVCGLVYYVSMREMEKKKKRDVVFLHVPMLQGEAAIQVGVWVAEELVKSLVDVWAERT